MDRSAARVTKPVPPLRAGDRMTAREFFRRYEADPDVVRAELIGGVVSIHARRVRNADGTKEVVPAVHAVGHAEPLFQLIGWLWVYAAHTPGVQGSGPATVQETSRDNAPEPDGFLRLLPKSGGGTETDDRGFLRGAPEFVFEVSNTSAAHDLGPKFDTYLKDGVKEYLVWRTADGVIDWFVRKRKRYVPLAPDAAGVVGSETFPGLWLNVPALLGGDAAQVFATVLDGVASPEHAAFAAKLRATAARRKPKG